MLTMPTITTAPHQDKAAESRPQYEVPQIRQMTEREILNTFQVTQSMGGWWMTGGC